MSFTFKQKTLFSMVTREIPDSFGAVVGAIQRKQEPMSRSVHLHYIPVTAFSSYRPIYFLIDFPWNEAPVGECHDQSQQTHWRHGVTGPELPFFHKRNGTLKMDQSVKMP